MLDKTQDDTRMPLISTTISDDSADEALVAPDLEGYQMLEQIGQGGMGTVWSAIQKGTQRKIALKILGTGTMVSAKARLRFEREVELTARLEHPNIASRYDSGIHKGAHY